MEVLLLFDVTLCSCELRCCHISGKILAVDLLVPRGVRCLENLLRLPGKPRGGLGLLEPLLDLFLRQLTIAVPID